MIRDIWETACGLMTSGVYAVEERERCYSQWTKTTNDLLSGKEVHLFSRRERTGKSSSGRGSRGSSFGQGLSLGGLKEGFRKHRLIPDQVLSRTGVIQ